MVFQLVRNTTAIWRNAARYCWFKMDLFVSKLYIKPARERRSRDVRRHQRTAILLPQPSAAVPLRTPKLRPRRETLPTQGGSGGAAEAWKERCCPQMNRGDSSQPPAPTLRADGLSLPQPLPSERGDKEEARRRSQANRPLGLPSRQPEVRRRTEKDTRVLTPSWLHPCLLHPKGHLRVLVAQ